MIAHPTAETLLARFGNTAEGRRHAREMMTRGIVRAAREEAALAGLSLTCVDRTRRWGPDHAPCGNPGGQSCLCACHDPRPAAAAA